MNGLLREKCTVEKCPKMVAGPGYSYLWTDNRKYKKPTELPVPVYIDLLFDSTDDRLSNEAIFPAIIGTPFPENFESVVKHIMRRLFRVYTHCFYEHPDHLTSIDILKHFNTSFKPFFSLQNSLI
jgi:MOB kinase activator 1